MGDDQKYTVLHPDMINNVGALFTKISPSSLDVDYFHKLKDKMKDVGKASMEDLGQLGADSLWAMNICLNNISVCEAFKLEAKRRLDNQESLAFLERAPAYLEKVIPGKVDKKTGEASTPDYTDGKRTKYVDVDKSVLDTRLLHNNWSVLTDFFNNMADWWREAHNWIKKQLDKEIRMTQPQQQ